MEASTFTVWIASGGMRSQLTVSPNGSLKRAPFTYTARPWLVPVTGDAVKPRNRMSGWNGLPDVSLIVALGMLSRMARVSEGTWVRSISALSSTWVACGSA